MTITIPHDQWQERAAAKRAANLEALPRSMILPVPPGAEVLDVMHVPATCGLLTGRELNITESKDVTVLLGQIARAEYSALEVATAFIKRAVIAQQLVNCVTETFFERALKQAQKLDDHLRATGKTVGPLHGLPISLKDQIEVKGTECTMSYVGWLGNVPEEDALIVTILEEQGAIMYCRSNMSQGLSCLNSDNNVYGRTLNPYNRNLGPGGSSGGEGALLAMRGSLLGVGSDLAGSIRVPAAHCGVFGLRPSRDRVPKSKASDAVEGQSMVSSVLGPMSPSLPSLALFLRAVLLSKPWLRDPLCVRMPWSESQYRLEDHGGDPAIAGGGKPKLCFGIMWDDGRVRPTPAVRRALERVKRVLEGEGHEVREWVMGDVREMGRLLSGIASGDGNADLKYQTSLSGEPILAPWYDPKHPRPDIPTSALYTLNHQRTAYITAELDRWNATASETSTGRPFDAIIAPVTPGPAFAHDEYQYAYTGWVNLADYASVAFPAGRVDRGRDARESREEDGDGEGAGGGMGREAGWEWVRSEEERKVWAAYDVEKTHGAPIGLQCVGRKYEEEAVLRMTGIIVEALETADANDSAAVDQTNAIEAA